MTEITYSISNNRISKSLIFGLQQTKEEALELEQGSDYHMVIFEPVDGGSRDAVWGRLKYDIELEENMVYITYLFGSNEILPKEELSSISDLRSLDAVRVVDQNDILLYNIYARYLYVGIEIYGEGNGKISNIRIDKAGDTFMNTMPGIYQERNSFFHRYLSIFSSIYNDFDEEIRNLPKLLDVNTCPKEFLIIYGKWLGIDIDCDFQDEEIMRALVREAYELTRIKGTKKALLRICEIILGEKVIILEKNIMQVFNDERNRQDFDNLFGNNVYNVVILLNQVVPEILKSQLMYVVEQFAPVRARIQIVNLKKDGELDSHSYLDMNAKLFESRDGVLDQEMALDKAVTLVE